MALAESDRESGATFALEFSGDGEGPFGSSVFGDLTYNVTFVTVPEPRSFLLTMTGAAAVCALNRRRSRIARRAGLLEVE